MTADTDILFERRGAAGVVTLNRPKALNAVTHTMVRALAAKLAEWARDAAVTRVIVVAAGGRAFSAGGDIRALYELIKAGRHGEALQFWRDEYMLNTLIKRYPKPYIALIDGITMGGGAGISVNGGYRIATERTLFAMPETAIGLFPDVGATRFLNRCSGHLGRYLGLTGARLGAADALYCGFATHFVPRDRVSELVEKLGGLAWEAGRESEQIDAVLADFAKNPGSASLEALRPAIDRCFAGGNVEAILVTLAAQATSDGAHAGWAAETRAGLLTKSPTSLKLTLRQLMTGRDYDLEAALALEYRLTQHVMAGHDFYEGVRAMLIDKDQTPRWRPATLAEVSDRMIEAYFAPIGDRELRFT